MRTGYNICKISSVCEIIINVPCEFRSKTKVTFDSQASDVKINKRLKDGFAASVCRLSANRGSLEENVLRFTLHLFYPAPQCLTKLQMSYAPPTPATVIVSASGEESSSLWVALFGSVHRGSSHGVYRCCKRWWKSRDFSRLAKILCVQNRVTATDGN